MCMLDVSIRNPLLIKVLEEFAHSILIDTPRATLDTLRYQDSEKDIDCEEGCSREYLDSLLSKEATYSGWPRASLGFDINTAKSEYTPKNWVDSAKQLDNGVMEAIGVGFSALKMYYPAKGYIGWHNNCNCPGQNLLLTYSKSGDGYFEYMNPISKEIIRMNDRPGWTAKVGYYGSDREPDKIMWHCAKTYEPRLTVSYVIRDQSMWEYMVEDIQSDQ